MHRGYIKLWRRCLDHEFYNEKRPLTKREAWETILLRVNHKHGRTIIGNTVFDVEPGESVMSVESWAETFRWTRAKTRRFFKLLASCSQIVLQNERQTTRLTVCNWESYQGDAATEQYTERPANGQQTASKRPQSKNGRMEEGNKNPPHTPRGSDHCFNRFWTAYPRKVGKGAALRAWARIKKPGEVLTAILAALEWQKRSEQWTKDGGQYIPHPATYLNQRRWEDEPQAPIETQSTNPIHQPWRPESD